VCAHVGVCICAPVCVCAHVYVHAYVDGTECVPVYRRRAGSQFRCSALRSGKRLAHGVPYARGRPRNPRSGAQSTIFGYCYNFSARVPRKGALKVPRKTIGVVIREAKIRLDEIEANLAKNSINFIARNGN